jgi:hypothetical protein
VNGRFDHADRKVCVTDRTRQAYMPRAGPLTRVKIINASLFQAAPYTAGSGSCAPVKYGSVNQAVRDWKLMPMMRSFREGPVC